MLRTADGASLLTAANATDTQSFDSGNVCATYGDRGFVFVKNNCFSPITVGLEVRALMPVLFQLSKIRRQKLQNPQTHAKG